MPQQIKVKFITKTGLAKRRPVAHTCENVIQLSTEYLSLEDKCHSVIKGVLMI